MLWVCLHFPELPLDVFARAQPGRRSTVVSSVSHRPDVVAADAAARARGIVPGIAVAAALALDGDLVIHLRDERAEALALGNIALWALQWTPTLSIEPPACVLLEISGCLQYFGGRAHLRQRIDAGLGALGFPALMAIAPTPLAASLFARAGQAVAIEHADTLAAPLDALPVTLFAPAWDASVLQTLEGLGARTLGEVRALPRDGVARRFGQRIIDDLDRAYGARTDPQPPFVAPERYQGQLELPAPVAEADALLFALHRLVVELAGFLEGRGAGVTRLRCDLVHEEGPPTSLVQGLAATRRVEHMMTVLRERLAREQLPGRVEAIRLIGEETAPLAAREGELFASARKPFEAGAELLERLRARLGDDAVHALALHADHRPERAQAHGVAQLPETAATTPRRTARAPARSGTAGRSPAADGVPVIARPLWLMSSPRRLEHGPVAADVALLSGPERIESGWWDGDDVGRDYFVGRDARGETLWLYRDRAGDWFVHGVFA
jgi:protein ImuB